MAFATPDTAGPGPVVTGWIRLAPAAALPRGAAAGVQVDGELIAVCHTDSGYHAVDEYCPHMGGSLSEGTLSGDTVTCPWHGWRYDLVSGARADRPGPPVRTYPIAVREGWIFLSPDPDPGLERSEDESRQC